jgi:hypothetical protein
MQDQPSAVEVQGADDEVEREVGAAVGARAGGPWSVWELGLEIGSERAAADAVLRLHAAGLVHLCHAFVWPTRPTARLHRLIDTA